MMTMEGRAPLMNTASTIPPEIRIFILNPGKSAKPGVLKPPWRQALEVSNFSFLVLFPPYFISLQTFNTKESVSFRWNACDSMSCFLPKIASFVRLASLWVTLIDCHVTDYFSYVTSGKRDKSVAGNLHEGKNGQGMSELRDSCWCASRTMKIQSATTSTLRGWTNQSCWIRRLVHCCQAPPMRKRVENRSSAKK